MIGLLAKAMVVTILQCGYVSSNMTYTLYLRSVICQLNLKKHEENINTNINTYHFSLFASYFLQSVFSTYPSNLFEDTFSCAISSLLFKHCGEGVKNIRKPFLADWRLYL